MTQQRTTLSAGAALPPVTKTLTQEKIAVYSDAGGDHNPLHTDAEFAAKTQFGGTIAHGMLLLAYVSEMLTAAFGRDWAASGRLKVRFRRTREGAGEGKKNELVHTLNGTAISNARAIVALLENHQQRDGSIRIPKALVPYLGTDRIGPR